VSFNKHPPCFGQGGSRGRSDGRIPAGPARRESAQSTRRPPPHVAARVTTPEAVALGARPPHAHTRAVETWQTALEGEWCRSRVQSRPSSERAQGPTQVRFTLHLACSPSRLCHTKNSESGSKRRWSRGTTAPFSTRARPDSSIPARAAPLTRRASVSRVDVHMDVQTGLTIPPLFFSFRATLRREFPRSRAVSTAHRPRAAVAETSRMPLGPMRVDVHRPRGARWPPAVSPRPRKSVRARSFRCGKVGKD